MRCQFVTRVPNTSQAQRLLKARKQVDGYPTGSNTPKPSCLMTWLQVLTPLAGVVPRTQTFIVLLSAVCNRHVVKTGRGSEKEPQHRSCFRQDTDLFSFFCGRCTWRIIIDSDKGFSLGGRGIIWRVFDRVYLLRPCWKSSAYNCFPRDLQRS